jgi:hypothetical protein
LEGAIQLRGCGRRHEGNRTRHLGSHLTIEASRETSAST